VPAFFRWPVQLKSGANIAALTSAVDIFPTLAELCGVDVPNSLKLDGRSLVPLLRNPPSDWPDRFLFTHLGRWERGQIAESKYKECAVRSQRYRLVNNSELYDIVNDPGQMQNIIEQHPTLVSGMRKAYDEWWTAVQPRLINEDVPFANENAFATLYREQAEEAP
jgi:arylsulfatase